MPESLPDLENQKASLVRKIAQLGDLRPGSITTTSGRCGNPTCHCHQAGDAGHGPNFRLTYKAHGKTVTESFASLGARRKAEQEIEEYRKWQQLSRDYVEVNSTLCRLRPSTERGRHCGGKNDGSDPAGSYRKVEHLQALLFRERRQLVSRDAD
jgi:hypothetical protein